MRPGLVKQPRPFFWGQSGKEVGTLLAVEQWLKCVPGIVQGNIIEAVQVLFGAGFASVEMTGRARFSGKEKSVIIELELIGGGGPKESKSWNTKASSDVHRAAVICDERRAVGEHSPE